MDYYRYAAPAQNAIKMQQHRIKPRKTHFIFIAEAWA
jgi:hypothetical protein